MLLYFYTILHTPLGIVLVIADDRAVRVVQIVSRDNIARSIDIYQARFNNAITCKLNTILKLLKHELEMYFIGNLQQFTVPLFVTGTMFQQVTWAALQKIPYAQSVSYQQIATLIGSPRAMRAVGGANGANPIMILIPCHRVIKADGKIGGYAGGIENKQWLLEHEKTYNSLHR